MRHGDNIIKGIHDKAIAEIKEILLSGNLKMVGVKHRMSKSINGIILVDEVRFTYQQGNFKALSNYARELLTELVRKDLENWHFHYHYSSGPVASVSFREDQIPNIKIKMHNLVPNQEYSVAGNRNRDWNHDL